MRRQSNILQAFVLAIVLAISGGESVAEGLSALQEPVVEQEPLFAIIYRAGPRWKPGVPMEAQGLQGHFYYLSDLVKSGKVALAGPLGPDGGLVLLRATDQTAAERMMAADPAVTGGLFLGEVRGFLPRLASERPIQAIRP